MEIGQQYTSTMIVGEEHLACHVGSGDLQVLATPIMMALMENAAMQCVAGDLDEESTTVGGQISSSHLKPTPPGHTITATAQLIGIDGRKLQFKISAFDQDGSLIGEGEHLRFVVNRTKFMSKL